MCGIVGLLTKTDGIERVISGLERLEYRGYDSSGIATFQEGRLEVRRAKGKLQVLKERLREQPLQGQTIIGHTRWATHGSPSDRNAHPMAAESVCLAHNGIIDNFQSLRREVLASGKTLSSETDTEIIAHLLHMEMERLSDPLEALWAIKSRLHGAYAFIALFADYKDCIFMIRQGAPLVVGFERGEAFIGSDHLAIGPLTRNITYLEDGDWGCLSRDACDLRNQSNQKVERKSVQVGAGIGQPTKGRYRHFMHKEIHQQSIVAIETLQKYLRSEEGHTLNLPEIAWKNYQELMISGCGTAYYAGLVARYWFEDLAGLATQCEISSELRYRSLLAKERSLSLFISQSGETMDTLEAHRNCKKLSMPTLSICNVANATLDRESDTCLHTCAGVEVSVASTKAFTAQLVLLYMLALDAGRVRGHLNAREVQERLAKLLEIPRLIAEAKRCEAEIVALAKELSVYKNILYMGRGVSYPMAMEGALKLKEVSYIHAEGLAAGELKHGSIALIEKSLPVVVIAPRDRLSLKTLNNMRELLARQAPVILLSDAVNCEELRDVVRWHIALPEVTADLAPMVYTLPLHLLAYHVGVSKGTDVDQPRNLAKSVTVE